MKIIFPTLLIGQVATDMFVVSFFVYSISFLFEGIAKGSIVQYLDLNRVLAICLVSGILSALLMPSYPRTDSKITRVASAFFFSALVGVIIWRYTSQTGYGALFYGVLASCLVLLVSRSFPPTAYER